MVACIDGAHQLAAPPAELQQRCSADGATGTSHQPTQPCHTPTLASLRVADDAHGAAVGGMLCLGRGAGSGMPRAAPTHSLACTLLSCVATVLSLGLGPPVTARVPCVCTVFPGCIPARTSVDGLPAGAIACQPSVTNMASRCEGGQRPEAKVAGGPGMTGDA
eukprot:scaffold61618_cov15-Tisochrysis_lutea.AAC.3